ncbi:MAG TPA: hypothetical protein VHF25_03170 [Nitriliruptorales bacterium]|nr:hypothetical protein [Nitriliruptorales bacterium]
MASSPAAAIPAASRLGDGAHRSLLHGYVVAVAWGILAACWVVVAGKTPTRDYLLLAAVVAVSLAVLVPVNVWWVVHNQRLHRAKGPRRQVPVVIESFDRDHLGRELAVDPKQVRTAAYVHISVEGDRKLVAAAVPGSESR